MEKVLDNIKEDLNMISDQPELIHEKSFMPRMMDPWAAELPLFQEYLDKKMKHQKTHYFNSTSTTKEVLLKELRKDMFSTNDQDKRESNQIIEDLEVVAVTSWLQELLDPKKYTYPLMYEYGAEYSWDGSSDNLKEALIGFMAVNDLSEISFAGATSQLQVFGRIGMASSADISNMARNGFLDRPIKNKETSDKKTSLFHDLPEEFHITAIMCAVQEAPATRQSNADAMGRHRNAKQERDNLVKREGLERATYEFIQCLIYR